MHMTITDDFSALGLSEQMLAAVRAKGFETPTAIQKLTIPHLLTKPNDIIAQSQTGTGKTAAYGLPILQTLEPARGPIQAIILVPTRELALQAAEELLSYNREKRLSITADLRRCGDERTAASPCQRHRHRRRDTGARARPHPPRHDETGKRPLPRARRSRRDAQHGLRGGRRRDHEPHQRRAARAALLGDDARAHHPAFENLHARHGDRARGTQANHGRPHRTNLFRGTRGRQVRRPDPHHRRRTRILRHHLRPHQDRRRRNRLAPDGARLRSRGAARRRVAGAAREDTPQIPRPHDQYPGGYRRGRPGHRRGQPDPRHQLLAAAGLGELRAPHRPHGPRRQAGNGHHVRLALGVPRPE